MLISWVISLQPAKPVSISPNLGRAAHAWFLERVRQADPPLAEKLHQGHGQRPFTVSNLLGIGRRHRGELTLSPETTYALRMTSFSTELSKLLCERVIPDLPPVLTLGSVTLAVTGSTTDPAVHDRAGEDSFAGLVQRHTLAASIPHRVSLRFASPTLFRSENKNVPLPLPGLVFGGLVDKWNDFAPIGLPPEVRRFAQECLAISRYRLETLPVSFGDEGQRGAVAGCVGTCSYAIQVRDKYWMGLIHLLAAFAFYAGVGRRTTMGLGQARALTQKH
ncbi:MAG: CRISPR-associated endoribonuclease Cas6 [Chloroflexota bacterium]|nr:CRISPR-associated endoribonuclease Cas6 [Chloroflexota bacterium]